MSTTVHPDLDRLRATRTVSALARARERSLSRSLEQSASFVRPSAAAAETRVSATERCRQ